MVPAGPHEAGGPARRPLSMKALAFQLADFVERRQPSGAHPALSLPPETSLSSTQWQPTSVPQTVPTLQVAAERPPTATWSWPWWLAVAAVVLTALLAWLLFRPT